MEGLSLDPTQAAESSEVKRNLEFVVSDWFKIKIGWLNNVDLEQEMKNLACGDPWILLVVTGLKLRRVENEETSYCQMGSCVSWPCSQERSGGDYRATGIAVYVQLARVGTSRTRSSHIYRMGYLPWLMSCWLLRLNPGAQGEHLKGIYVSLGGRWVGKGGRVLSWEGGKDTWLEWGGKVGKVYEWGKVE